MVQNLINKSINFMIQNGAIPDTKEQREIYAYGMELQIYYSNR